MHQERARMYFYMCEVARAWTVKFDGEPFHFFILFSVFLFLNLYSTPRKDHCIFYTKQTRATNERSLRLSFFSFLCSFLIYTLRSEHEKKKKKLFSREATQTGKWKIFSFFLLSRLYFACLLVHVGIVRSDEKGFCNLACDSTKPAKLWPSGSFDALFSDALLRATWHGGLTRDCFFFLFSSPRGFRPLLWMFLRRLLEDFSGFRFMIYCERRNYECHLFSYTGHHCDICCSFRFVVCSVYSVVTAIWLIYATVKILWCILRS